MRTASPPGPTAGPASRPVAVADLLLIDVLAARCRDALVAIEAQGGPDVDTHLAMLGHALSRTRNRTPALTAIGTQRDREQVERTLSAITTGAGATGGTPCGARSDRRLLTDLRRLERILTRAARIGARPGIAATVPPVPVRPGAGRRGTG